MKPFYIPKDFILNKKFLLQVISFNSNIYFQIPFQNPLRADKDIRYECYKYYYDFTKDIIDWEIKPEEDIIECVYKHDIKNPCSCIFYFIHSSVTLEKEFVLKLMRDSNCGKIFEFLQNEELKNDYDIVKEALTFTPDIISKVPRKPFDFTDCKELAFIVLKQKPKLISYFHLNIRLDIEIVKFVIELDPTTFLQLANSIQDNPDIAILAISNGLPFNCISWKPDLMNNMDVLLALVKHTNGVVLNDKSFPQIFKNSLEFAKMVFCEVKYQGDYFNDDVRFEATCQHKKSANK